MRAEFPEFDLTTDGPVRFTGEMVYPWHFSEDPALIPLADCAEELAYRSDWPPLYDLDRLAANTVPAAAVVYFDDMYGARCGRRAGVVAGDLVAVRRRVERGLRPTPTVPRCRAASTPCRSATGGTASPA